MYTNDTISNGKGIFIRFYLARFMPDNNRTKTILFLKKFFDYSAFKFGFTDRTPPRIDRNSLELTAGNAKYLLVIIFDYFAHQLSFPQIHVSFVFVIPMPVGLEPKVFFGERRPDLEQMVYH